MLAWQLPEFFQTWDKGGPFIAGIVFGAGVTIALLQIVSGERKARLKIDSERETESRKQLAEKDKRIDALHEQISKLLSERASEAPPEKKQKNK